MFGKWVFFLISSAKLGHSIKSQPWEGGVTEPEGLLRVSASRSGGLT
jgi:hypothetical protein